MDVSGFIGHVCDRDRRIGDNRVDSVWCGWGLPGLKMAAAFGCSQVGSSVDLHKR